MPELTVDYLVPITVRVDTDADKVLGVSIHAESFQMDKNRRVFTSGVDDLPEYLYPETYEANDPHPHAQITAKAFNIAERVRLVPSEGPLVYVEEHEEPADPYQYAERNVGQERSE